MLNYEFPPLGGGAANANYYLLKEFRHFAELNVDLVTSHNKKEVAVENFAPNIKIHFLPIKKEQLHYWKQREVLSYSWLAYNYIKRLVKEKKFDLAHAFFALPCGWLASHFQADFPYIVSLRGSDVPGFNQRLDKFNWLLRPVFRQVLDNAAAVIANSDDLRKLALKSWSGKIKVIPNGVDTTQFRPISESHEQNNNKFFKIITVSRLVERKNLDLLIQSLALVKDTNWQLEIIGTGTQETELKQLTQKLGVTERVKFYGYIPHDQLPNYYQQADLFVLPSENEGMSNALLEAMACGLPVLVKDTGAARQLVNGNGVIFKQNNANLVAEVLTNLMVDKKRLKQMAKVSLAKVKSCTWHAVSMSYARLYYEVTKAN